MINAVNQDVEEQSGHLAESEVARLLSVLQNAEFTRSDTRNVKRDTSFKPRTLIEIASEAQAREIGKRLAQTAADHAANAPDLTDDPVNDVGQAAAGNADMDNAAAAAPENSLPVQPISDDAASPAAAAEMTAGESDVDGTPKPDLASNEFDADRQISDADASQNMTAHDNEQEVKVAAGFETANEAFERGKAEGVAEGRQAAIAETKAAAEMAAKAELADIVLAFDKALVALAKPQAVQAEILTRSIHAAILRLASERAGQQIDDMPKAFADRIDALVNAVGKKINDGEVQLNPDDYTVMAPYFTDTAFGFVANPDLMRGDVVLRFEGVELVDIAKNRTGSHYTSEIATSATADPHDSDASVTDTVSGNPTDIGQTNHDDSSDITDEPGS